MAEQFLTRSALALTKPARTLGASAQALLREYQLPGNVRELSNLIERAVLFCGETTLEATNFPGDVQQAAASPRSRYFPWLLLLVPNQLIRRRSTSVFRSVLKRWPIWRTGSSKKCWPVPAETRP